MFTPAIIYNALVRPLLPVTYSDGCYVAVSYRTRQDIWIGSTKMRCHVYSTLAGLTVRQGPDMRTEVVKREVHRLVYMGAL